MPYPAADTASRTRKDRTGSPEGAARKRTRPPEITLPSAPRAMPAKGRIGAGATGKAGPEGPDSPEDSDGFRILTLQQFARGGRWRTEAMRSYPQPVLIWFTKGQGRITISGNTRGYGPHNAIFIPAGTMHGFDMLGQVFGTIIFFPIQTGLELPQEPMQLRFREAVQQAELTMMIDNIQREASADLPGRTQALHHHGGLLAIWLRRQALALPDTESEGRRAAHRLASAYTALVERDFHLGKSVSDYAAELGVTPTHLSRACNIACARPASEILAERIHYEARRLLSETRRPVKEIASHLGFRSAAYFTRAFQKRTGKSPTAFRNSG